MPEFRPCTALHMKIEKQVEVAVLAVVINVEEFMMYAYTCIMYNVNGTFIFVVAVAAVASS